ncbi:hypothetical protein C482_15271 [Natrialba chahannaoensis JCM 10990]|uniref:Uncharacterized protein n=1 Tax=Natrialba chahannaoensis JCM 10990 TaxID=1227492 RepID=M0AFU3_9EURY|nr:hypothetical protein [Natrialba chahannaoensis]ELY96747.1 hypothetical protein C482_15271 [Natrialba chahannaoensis JCM 10990]
MPHNITPTFALATQLTGAHDIPIEELDRKWHDRWADEDEDWLIVLNGSATPWFTKAMPVSTDHFDDPFVAKVPPGCAFVMIDDEAVAVIHPTHNEYFTAPGHARAWERALLSGFHDRLRDLSADVPALEDLVDELPDGDHPTPT